MYCAVTGGRPVPAQQAEHAAGWRVLLEPRAGANLSRFHIVDLVEAVVVQQEQTRCHRADHGDPDRAQHPVRGRCRHQPRGQVGQARQREHRNAIDRLAPYDCTARTAAGATTRPHTNVSRRRAGAAHHATKASKPTSSIITRAAVPTKRWPSDPAPGISACVPWTLSNRLNANRLKCTDT